MEDYEFLNTQKGFTMSKAVMMQTFFSKHRPFMETSHNPEVPFAGIGDKGYAVATTMIVPFKWVLFRAEQKPSGLQPQMYPYWTNRVAIGE